MAPKVLSIIISLVLFCWSADAQVEGGFQEAKLLKAPTVSAPKEAKKTNIGGKVVVRVTVDETGNVVSVDDVIGPGAVCRSVQRSDIVAIRNAASRAAKQAKFSPALANNSPLISSTTIEFDFPVKKDDSKSTNYAVVRVKEASSGNETGGKKVLTSQVFDHNPSPLPKPVYPKAAIAVKASGTVPVQVLILEDGTVFSAEAKSGHPLLRPSAVTAACGAKFAQTILVGKPVKVSGIISYNFNP